MLAQKHLYADDAKMYIVINQISDQADLQAFVNTEFRSTVLPCY